jgi:brefeldin A-inhibited guanine nucleotide-exchange protein
VALGDNAIILPNKKVFTDVIRDSLIESILKNSLSQEKKLFVSSLNVFCKLVWYFRDSLRGELEKVIENVYFKILDSNNSSFDRKQYILKVFKEVFNKAQVLVEMFVNYDCRVGETNLVERLLEN